MSHPAPLSQALATLPSGIVSSYWAKPKRSPAENETIFYTKNIVIPAGWQGTELEFFSAGLEGDDEVFFNGRLIGKTEEENTILTCHDERLFGEDETIKVKGVVIPPNPAKKGNTQNVRHWSDPFTISNLIKRFYKIPPNLVKWGGVNSVEIRMHGKFATGISESIFIRETSTPQQQKAVIEFDNKGGYLEDMRNLKAVDETAVPNGNLVIEKDKAALLTVKVTNNNKDIAFFVNLNLYELEGKASIFFSDNYFALLPGAEKDVTISIHNDKNVPAKTKAKAQLRLKGWNVKNKIISKPFSVTLV